jgi:hypothetical protein
MTFEKTTSPGLGIAEQDAFPRLPQNLFRMPIFERELSATQRRGPGDLFQLRGERRSAVFYLRRSARCRRKSLIAFVKEGGDPISAINGST